MNGTFIYLNKNSYTKDGNYRCFASFASSDGNVLSFNASACQQDWPVPFSVCRLDFDIQQFGNNGTSFILKDFEVAGRLVESDKK